MKQTHTVVRIPSNNWENLMETVTLDGSYSEEIKNEVWTAIENIKFYSNPWVVIVFKNKKAIAKIFNNEESAQKYAKKFRGKSFCIKAQYRA